MTDLKPCPFCGGEAEALDLGGHFADYITCIECEADGPRGGHCNLEDAIELWNRRIPERYDEADIAALDEAKALLDELEELK